LNEWDELEMTKNIRVRVGKHPLSLKIITFITNYERHFPKLLIIHK